ncbi:hypothetical protein NPIL_176891, partial [Nephila pilipes]
IWNSDDEVTVGASINIFSLDELSADVSEHSEERYSMIVLVSAVIRPHIFSISVMR